MFNSFFKLSSFVTSIVINSDNHNSSREDNTLLLSSHTFSVLQ